MRSATIDVARTRIAADIVEQTRSAKAAFVNMFAVAGSNGNSSWRRRRRGPGRARPRPSGASRWRRRRRRRAPSSGRAPARRGRGRRGARRGTRGRQSAAATRRKKTKNSRLRLPSSAKYRVTLLGRVAGPVPLTPSAARKRTTYATPASGDQRCQRSGCITRPRSSRAAWPRRRRAGWRGRARPLRLSARRGRRGARRRRGATSASTSGSSPRPRSSISRTPEVDVAEQPPLGGRQEERARGRALASAPRRAGARRRAGCRHAGGRWSCAASRQSEATATVCSRSPPVQEWWVSGVAGRTRSRAAEVGVADEAPHERPQSRVGDLGGEELEEAVQLLEVAAALGNKRRRGRPRPARASGPRAGGGRGSARPGRAPARRPPPRTACRGARRRSRPGPRSCRWGRRARGRGTGCRSVCEVAASGRLRRGPRQLDPRPAPRSTPCDSRSEDGW